MKRTVVAALAALLFLSTPTLAALVADLGGGGRVVLSADQCENEVVEQTIVMLRTLDKGIPEKFQAGILMVEGTPVPLCWAPLSSERIFVVDAIGGMGFIPLSAFRNEDGI